MLQDAGVAGLGLAAAATLGRAASASAASTSRVVVVGGGLAGLTCALRLKQAGVTAHVHEASDRLGGRCWTIRDSFDEGQIAEHGGELIDQGHTAIRHLAQELGLRLDNLLQAERNGTEPLYWFDGAALHQRAGHRRPQAGLAEDPQGRLRGQLPTTFESSTERGDQLDHMSIIDWINESVPGGIDSRLGQLLDVGYNIEYGAESSEQSALNLLYLLGYSGQGNLRIFGPSNEKYRVHGGNDQIPQRMGEALAGQVTMNSALTAIARRSDGAYSLTFGQSGGPVSVVADKVVLAIPFSILRSEVNFQDAGFSALKRTAIEELGMGTNSKLHLQFSTRHWESLDCNGETYADTGYQNTWDVTRAQPGTAGILVDYTGGNVGASFGSGTPSSRAQQFLGQIEPVLPGLASQWNGKATIDFWLGNPFTKGSYSYWKVGQYTRFAGIEGRPEGDCHFAGEHTSIDFQGYLNGAVETGERAAEELLDELR